MSQIRYSQRSLAGTWSVPLDLTGTTSTRERPSIATSSFNPHVVWADYRDGNSEMSYKHGSLVATVGEGVQPQVRRLRPIGSLVRGVLLLPGMGTRSGLSDNPVMSRAKLLDAAGQTVKDLHVGANDLSKLAPGVYFVREQSASIDQYSGRRASGVRREASGVTKVVIQR